MLGSKFTFKEMPSTYTNTPWCRHEVPLSGRQLEGIDIVAHYRRGVDLRWITVGHPLSDDATGVVASDYEQ